MLGGKQTNKKQQKRKKTTKKERYSCCEKGRLKEIIKWVKKKNRLWLCYVILSTYSIYSSFRIAVLGTR